MDYDIMKCYGGWTEIISFLQPMEALVLQHLTKWMYSRGVARSQVRFNLFIAVVDAPPRAPAVLTPPRYPPSQLGLEPHTITHNKDHGIWVVANLVDVDNKPKPSVLDCLQPRAQGWAEVRTVPDAENRIWRFTFITYPRRSRPGEPTGNVEGRLYLCKRDIVKPYTLVEIRTMKNPSLCL